MIRNKVVNPGVPKNQESALIDNKKRKSISKSKESINESDDYFSDQDEDSLFSRKSKRLQNQITEPVSPHKSTTKTIKIIDSNHNDRKQLNGAQFVAAAAAGNFNVSASIGSTSITIDSNSNVDLSQLSQNVDILNSTLKQHSIYLKQLNNSIEKLSQKIDTKIPNNDFPKKQNKTVRRKLIKNVLKDTLVELTIEKEKEEDDLIEALQDGDFDEEEEDYEQTETINEPIKKKIQYDQNISNNDIEKSVHDNTDNESAYTEIESINPNQKDKDSIKDEQSETQMETEMRATMENENKDIISSESAKVTDENNNSNIQHLKQEFIQTVKLTNAGLELEKNSVQIKGTYYSSDSSKSDDDDDDDDEDMYQSESGLKSKSKSGSNSKSSTGTKAILNKTKIDTEFISKLIENKDPNDKRYDPNEINKLRLLSHSYQNFAVKLLMRLFEEEEIIGRNVYGRNYSGDKTFMKQPLDTERINFIKETVLRLTRTNNPELAWASCVIAMNRKMVDINNKFIKQNSKK